MEELFVCQSFDFIIDRVQKICISFLYCRSDCINITQRFDSYRKSFVLLCPCKYLCVICGEGISSSIKKCIISFLIFIKFYKLNIRIVFCEVCFCCCSLYNNQLLTFQIFYICDQCIIRRNNAESHFHIWKCKIYLFCSFICYCEVCKDHINLCRLQIFNTACCFYICKFYIIFASQKVFCKSLTKVNIVALNLAVFIYISKWVLVTEYTDLNLSVFFDFIKSTGLRSISAVICRTYKNTSSKQCCCCYTCC